MDKNLQEQLQRIENKLDLVLKTFSSDTKNSEALKDTDQYYFPWYNDFKPAFASDVLK
jgi:hypothetical protein